MGYAVGSDCRILSFRVYNYTTHRFAYPANVTFNDDVPAIPYISSLMNLSPAVRLKNRRVRKIFNGVEYEVKVIKVFTASHRGRFGESHETVLDISKDDH